MKTDTEILTHLQARNSKLETNPMKTAYFYSRVSTNHQDNSLEVQLAKARGYAIGRGLEISDRHIFTDSDTSGMQPFSERPGGQLLLNTLALERKIARQRGLPDEEIHLIITKLDRLGRSVLDLETQFQSFKSLGIVVHITDFGGDSMSTAGLAGELVLRILFAVAEFERGMIRSRASDVINHKREQGILLGTCPFGWDTVETGEINPKTSRPILKLVPNPNEQHWIRQMHTWRSGSLSYHAIAAQLNRAGVRTKKDRGRWQSGNVAHVLNNRYTKELLATEPHAAAA